MSLLRFHKKSDESAPVHRSAIEQEAADHAEKAMAAARRCLANEDFCELKNELGLASRKIIDILIDIDETELDPIRFSTRARLLIHKIKFLRQIQVMTEAKAGASNENV